MLVFVFGFVRVRVGVRRAVVVLVRMLVPDRLRVFVLVVVVGVAVCVGVFHTVRMFVGMLVLLSHGVRFGRQAASALPDSTATACVLRRGEVAARTQMGLPRQRRASLATFICARFAKGEDIGRSAFSAT